jgi:hypothetical protein
MSRPIYMGGFFSSCGRAEATITVVTVVSVIGVYTQNRLRQGSMSEIEAMTPTTLAAWFLPLDFPQR